MSTSNDTSLRVDEGCFRTLRVWDLALDPSRATFEESEHLLQCPRCRARVRKAMTALHAHGALKGSVAVLPLTKRLRADKPLRRFALADAAADEGVVLLPEQRLRFEGDANLVGNFYQQSDRSHWLALAHASRPAGTLLLVEISGASGAGLWRFVMLRPDHPLPTGRLCLEASLAAGDFAVDVTVVETATDLDANLAPELTASFDAARRDDPLSEPVWRGWAAREAAREDLPEAVAAALKEIAGRVGRLTLP